MGDARVLVTRRSLALATAATTELGLLTRQPHERKSCPIPSPALRASHERLAALVEPLTPDQVTAQAYPIEWSIAQVMSHLGSGAEIMGHNLERRARRRGPAGP